MKKIRKGKIRSVKDIKIVVRFKGQGEADAYTDAFGGDYHSDPAAYGDIFPVRSSAPCDHGWGEWRNVPDFLRRGFRIRVATAKVMRMSNYCSSMRGMLPESLGEFSLADSVSGAGTRLPNNIAGGLVVSESDALPLEAMCIMSRRKNTAEAAEPEDGAGYGKDDGEIRVHTDYSDIETEYSPIGDGEEPDGYVEVSTTGKLTEYERHYVISYSEYYRPAEEADPYDDFDGQRNVSVLIFKNNPDVVMISYNEFSDEFLTFVKNKTTLDFYSDDYNETCSEYDDDFYGDRDFGADYLTINTGDVSSTVDADSGGVKLNYTFGLFSGAFGSAEYSLKYQTM